MTEMNQPVEKQAEQFVVRFGSGQRAELKARAAANKRSMNAEILVLIEMGIASTHRVSA